MSYQHFEGVQQYFCACQVLGEVAIQTWCSHVGTSEFAYHMSRWPVRSLLSCKKEVIKHDLGLCWFYSFTSAYTVWYFARHVFYWSPCYLWEMPNSFSQLTCTKSLWDIVLFSRSKCSRICPLFWGHCVLLLPFLSFGKCNRITKETTESDNDQPGEW